MPGRDYYLDLDATRPYSNAYLSFMIELATALGVHPQLAKEEMTKVFQFETEMALV